ARRLGARPSPRAPGRAARAHCRRPGGCPRGAAAPAQGRRLSARDRVLAGWAREFHLALIDLNYTRDTTSGEEGLNLLSRAQSLDPTLPVVVMTAWGSVEIAVEAMRRGARDFIQKPWDNARLLAIIRTQIELSQAL